MDTTTAGPAPTTPAWWRRPLADLLDVVTVALAGVVVGVVVAAAILAGSGDDPWAGLAAALLGLGAGLVAGLAVWVSVLVLGARRGTTPGSRAAGLAVTRVPPMAARHVAVVVVLWAGAGAVAAATEPWPAGPLGGALAAAVATGVALAAWGRGQLRNCLRVVGIAAVAGLLLTGAVPDRAPYHWELREQAEAAVRGELEADPAAHRACDLAAAGVAAGPLASHATAPCHDPDREWLIDRHPAVVTEQLASVVAEVVDTHASVRIIDVREGREVHVDALAVATVVPQRDGCATLVVVGPGPPRTPRQADEACG